METAYQHELKKLKEKHEREMRTFQKHKDFFSLAEEYADKFSEYREYKEDKTLRYATVSYELFIWHCINLNLYLAEQDKGDAANPIIDAMIGDSQFDMTEHPEKILENTQIATWEFRPKGSELYNPRLRVNISYDRSNSCKLVPTGRFSEPHEIKIMVCS